MENKGLVSFVVVTYNRKDDLSETLSLLRAQTYRPIEIIVVDNNSSDGTELLFKGEFNAPFIRYIRLTKNRGVAGGRNVGIQQARGEIIIFLDDDALMIGPDSTQKIVEKFATDKSIGVLAFKSINYYTKQVAREEFPHRNKSLNPDVEFETTYFIGVAHAIRREVFTKISLYPEDFFYGFEELDLSFRVLNAGYRIIYFPSVTVLHKKSPTGRLPKSSVWRRMLENRIRTSIRNLPWRYVLISTLIWTGYTLLRIKGNVFVILQVYKNVLKDLRKLLRERSPIQAETVGKLKQLGGRLLY